ncbi:MAG TPA: fused response regulator/phosphatase [Vicinamibacterales bacterium]|nr:fused response regulator/phosphatase [Vicinamibacterales bacterium]
MKELSDCRVLIVDDVKANVDVLVQALSGEYKLSVALGGQQALDAVNRAQPDLILLDIVMPDIDGYEICRRLRAAETTRELPIMFLSSLEDVKDKAHGFEVGGNDYLTKPFEILEVKARVRSLLKAKSYADAVKAAAERDLRIAREIQTGLLPANIAAQIAGTGLDVGAVLEPARQVGGDLFEVLRLGPDRVLLAVGDVSGKGIPAALFMAVAMTILRSLARRGDPPAEILRQLNDELLEQNPRGMFVTLQCMLFDLTSKRVTCASAGHHAAVRISPGGSPELVFTTCGRVLGLMPAEEIGAETLDLHPGDTFVLFTDGVSEAFDPDGELFGEERLLTHLQSMPVHSARDTALGVLDAVRRHADGAKQSDDITVLSVRYDPSTSVRQ